MCYCRPEIRTPFCPECPQFMFLRLNEAHAENAELEKQLVKYRDLAIEGTEWQAVYRKQISELQDQLAECQKERDQFRAAYADAANDYNAGTDALTAAQARIAELVDACRNFNATKMKAALSLTDNMEALDAYRDEVIEECAAACEGFAEGNIFATTKDYFAVIRALKGETK